jgi:hypothetical protein
MDEAEVHGPDHEYYESKGGAEHSPDSVQEDLNVQKLGSLQVDIQSNSFSGIPRSEIEAGGLTKGWEGFSEGEVNQY